MLDRDFNHKEQMSMILRYFNLSNEVVYTEEDFNGFIHFTSTISENLRPKL